MGGRVRVGPIPITLAAGERSRSGTLPACSCAIARLSRSTGVAYSSVTTPAAWRSVRRSQRSRFRTDSPTRKRIPHSATSVAFTIAGEERLLTDGDLAIVPRETVFSYRNTGTSNARLLLLHAPPFD